MTPVAALAAAGIAVGAAFAGLPAVAASAPHHAPDAGRSVTIPADGALHDRLERFCGRAPTLVERAGKLQPRLAAGADTPGSLARLKARVAKAEQDDRSRRARVLQRRLERRTELAKRLPERLETLRAAQQECAAAGLGAAAGPPAAPGGR
jgi:hypothetical protein